MALFSRRPSEPGDDDEPGTSSSEPPPSADEAPGALPSDESVPQVNISVTAYRSGGVPASTPPPAEAAAPRPAAAADNVLLRQALAALTPESTPVEAIRAARQLLQGNLYVRVKGDVRALTASGGAIPWAVTRDGDDVLVLVYSGREAMSAALRRDRDTATSAVAFPSLTLLARILAGAYSGIMVDSASPPARLTLKRDFLERALADADPRVALKTLLAGARGPGTGAEIGLAMKSAPLFAAAGSAGEGASVGIAEVRAEDGARLIQIFSHPLEVVATGRGDRPVPFPAAQLGRALRDDPALGGVILDPAGPWIRLGRDELAPVIDAA